MIRLFNWFWTKKKTDYVIQRYNRAKPCLPYKTLRQNKQEQNKNSQLFFPTTQTAHRYVPIAMVKVLPTDQLSLLLLWKNNRGLITRTCGRSTWLQFEFWES